MMLNPKCFQVFWLVKLTTSEPSSFAGFHAEIPIVLVAKPQCLPVKPPIWIIFAASLSPTTMFAAEILGFAG